MLDIVTAHLTHLLATYGYWVVLLFVAVESMGVPVPGEAALIAAAVYAGTTHQLSVALVLSAAAVGAILGDNLGYLIGRAGGYRLLQRYGRYVRLDERRLRLGQYLFLRHGGKVVFFGRFVAVLRIWAAFLAGTYRMPWRRFLAYNAAGGIAWSTWIGLGAYVLGDNVQRVEGPVRIIALTLAALAMVAVTIYLRRNERLLIVEAERAALSGALGALETAGAPPPVAAEESAA